MALFKTSKEAREILENFRRQTGIRPNLWTRAALGYSLSLESKPQTISYDSEGSEFPEKVFFGDDEDVLLALLRQRLERVPDPAEIGPLIKAHVERGLRYFRGEFQRLNSRGDELLFNLIGQCSVNLEPTYRPTTDLLPAPPETASYALKIELGKESRKNDIVHHILNAPGAAPHLAIMGRNGTGKTRTGLSLISQINATSSYFIPFLIFDYAKGDIASDVDFVVDTDADVIKLPERMIPLTPLSLPRREGYAVQLAARRFRDTICSVVRLGPIQKDRCLQLIMRLYDDFGDQTPDLTDLSKLAKQEYQANGWNEDSLLACLREFSAFPLFRCAEEGEEHDLFKKRHIIDIHNLPEDLRKLASFLVLDRLYAEIMRLPDSSLDKDGNRQIRLIIVIDEAHHYLPCRQRTLEKMVREVRSKGVAVWLFSQSPDDFDQKQYNFAREMGLSIIFSCMLERPKMLEALLGGRVDPRKLSQLASGLALTRVQGTEAPIEIQAWSP